MMDKNEAKRPKTWKFVHAIVECICIEFCYLVSFERTLCPWKQAIK